MKLGLLQQAERSWTAAAPALTNAAAPDHATRTAPHYA
jgi:hypothetical protein